MTEPIQNRARNRFQNHDGTRSGTTDQTQTQIQTVVTSHVVVSGSDQNQSDRHLGPLAAPIGFGDLR